MFCNSGLCSNNSTNFNRFGCGCNNCNSCGCSNNSCGCNSCNSCSRSRSNFGCGWYCCPNNGSPSCCCAAMPTTPTTPSIPVVNLGNFTAASAPAIASGAVIPLTLTRQVGTQITSGGTGALLQPGTYEIAYSLTGTSATAGVSTVGAQLNGATIPAFSQSTTVATGDTYSLSGTGTVAVTAANSILNLVNLGANPQDFTNVNLVIRKIA